MAGCGTIRGGAPAPIACHPLPPVPRGLLPCRAVIRADAGQAAGGPAGWLPGAGQPTFRNSFAMPPVPYAGPSLLPLLLSPSWHHPGFAVYWPLLRRLWQMAAAGRSSAWPQRPAWGGPGGAPDSLRPVISCLQGAGGSAVAGTGIVAGRAAGAGPGTGGPTAATISQQRGGDAAEACWADPADPLNWQAADWLDLLNHLAAWRGLRTQAGRPLRFVMGEGEGAVDYERRIHDAGEIACRPLGAGARHDFHNALVWLRFPRLKAVCNHLHCQVAERQPSAAVSDPGAASSAAGHAGLIAGAAHAGAAADGAVGLAGAGTVQSARPGRGPCRDALTLLDENGALWPAAAEPWRGHLAARRWQALFVDGRAALLAAPAPVIVGHGLMEKLHRPYKSMTAKLLPTSSPRRGLDRGVSACLLDLAAQDRLRPAILLPWPVQGWPGWDPANAAAAFYDDPQVFRLPAAASGAGRG